jgi:nicotinate-nucleotide pyrophosphorylase (carboxylating)
MMLQHWHGTTHLIQIALAEDEVAYDPTSSLMPDDLTSEALMMPKADGVLAGVDVSLEVFRQVDPELETKRLVDDGALVEHGMYVAVIRGRMSSILRAERTALNFVQRMSGIATATNEFVQAVAGLPVQVIDTRKTVPGWRLLDKYSVRMGGGHNHRMSTGDGILIKDNHIAAMATRNENMTDLIRRAKRDAAHTIRIEVECDTLEQVREAVDAGADIILFDNMTAAQMREGVAICKGRALTEASGGITIENVREVAQTGVDLLSTGSITHSVKALDISLEVTPDSTSKVLA